MPGPTRRRLPRVLLALVVIAGLAAFLVFGPAEDEILSRQSAWKAAVDRNYLLAVLIFFVAEVVLVALSVPVATGLSVIAGLLFGRWVGTAVVSIASTAGAVLAMLTARYVLRDSIRGRLQARARWKDAVAAFDRGLSREGGFYLLLVRLTPVFPFFLVNVGMGLSHIRLRTYWWATQVGMLPVTFLVVSAGAEVGEVRSFRELAGIEHVWPVAMLIIVAIALRTIVRRHFRHHPDEVPGPLP